MSLLALPAVVSAAIPSGLLAADAPPVYAGNAQLVAACVLGILAVVVLITWAKVHPFLSLMLGSAVLGAVATMPPGETVKSFVAGFGTTAGAVGILIALGAMIGKLLEDSGGANRIVGTMVGRVGPGRLPWVMAAIAAILGLPLFFEVGVVLLVPVVVLVAQRTGFVTHEGRHPRACRAVGAARVGATTPRSAHRHRPARRGPRPHADLRHHHRDPDRRGGRPTARAFRRSMGTQVSGRPRASGRGLRWHGACTRAEALAGARAHGPRRTRAQGGGDRQGPEEPVGPRHCRAG